MPEQTINERKQTIDEQIAIMKAYADGKPVYMRKSGRNLIGTQVEPAGHQFNFEEYEYSLSPMDWCTGKDANSAYSTLLRYGTGNDDELPIYTVTRSAKHPYKDETLTYSMSAIDVVAVYPVFIAGAEWVLKNLNNGIDFHESLKKFREIRSEMQINEANACNHALHAI